ncbi:MAG: exo-alpha-sialidase [Lachnospiraceae bacterium]|nr:exo-alpha-sialidase [Lachnospiraceae bacterium]
MDIKSGTEILRQDPKIQTTVYHDREICPEGLQPFLYQTAKGTLIVQCQTPGQAKNSRRVNYPADRKTYISWDDGENFERFIFEEGRDVPFFEAGSLTLADGRFFFMDNYVVSDPEEPKEHAIGESWWTTDEFKTLTGPVYNRFYLPDIDFYCSSDDAGRTSAQGSTQLHRSMVQLPNGDILATIYGHFLEDKAPASYEPHMMKTRSWIVASSDGGKTFETRSVIAVDDGIGTEGFGEPAMVRISHGPHEGRLLCVMRTGRDLYEAHSDDDGYTWSVFRCMHFDGIDIYDINKWRDRFEGKYENVNVHRRSLSGAFVDPDLLEMKNGLIVLSFGVRIPAQLNWKDPTIPNNGVYCAISADGGETWSHLIRIMGGKLTTHYTSVREARNGDILFAYDVGAWGSKDRGGRMCRIKVEYENH